MPYPRSERNNPATRHGRRGFTCDSVVFCAISKNATWGFAKRNSTKHNIVASAAPPTAGTTPSPGATARELPVPPRGNLQRGNFGRSGCYCAGAACAVGTTVPKLPALLRGRCRSFRSRRSFRSSRCSSAALLHGGSSLGSLIQLLQRIRIGLDLAVTQLGVPVGNPAELLQ